VLEFNVWLGDPETQPLMFRMRSDLVRALLQAAMGKLEMEEFSWDPRPAVCVVMAAEGYPGSYPKGMAINGIEQTMRIKDTMVFQAGTALKDGKIVASGGRVLGVTAMGEGFRGAIENAYKAVSTIDFEHCHYRKDIGHRALMRDL
jgi:phosphoribosylamine--glycine ligase